MLDIIIQLNNLREMKACFIVFLMIAGIQLMAQGNLLWSNDSFEKIEWLEQLPDGSVMIGGDRGIYLVDNLSGEPIWKQDRKTNTEGMNLLEPYPIFITTGKQCLIGNTLTGEIYMDSGEAEMEVWDYYYFEEPNQILIEIKEDKMYKMLMMDIKSKEVKWKYAFAKAKGSLFKKITSSVFSTPVLESPPVFCHESYVLFHDKSIHVINSTNGELVWQKEFDEDVEEMVVDDTADLVVLRIKKKVFSLDIKTGRVLLEKELDDEGKRFEVNQTSHKLFVADKKTLYIFDTTNGNEILSHKHKDNINSLLKDEESGKIYVASNKLITEYDFDTAKKEREIETEDNISEISFFEDKIFLFQRNKVNFLDLKKFTLDWEKSYGIGYCRVERISDGYLLFSRGAASSSSSVVKVTASGQKVWHENLDGNEMDYLIMDKGILVYTTAKIDFLDLKSGKSIWDGSLDVNATTSWDYNDETGKLAYYVDKRVYLADMKSGELIKLKEKLGFKSFKEDEEAPEIQLLNDGIFVKGYLSFYNFDLKGNKKYEEHFPDVGMSGFAKTLLTVAAVASSGTALGSLGSDINAGKDPSYATESAAGFSNYSSSKLKARYANSIEMEDYRIILMKFKDEGKKGFGKIDIRTGEVVSKAYFDDKEPIYIMDDLDGVVFVVSKGKNVLAYKM